jgi:hypothetical protein
VSSAVFRRKGTHRLIGGGQFEIGETIASPGNSIVADHEFDERQHRRLPDWSGLWR